MADRRGFARLELRRLLAAFRRGCLRGTLAYAACLWLLVAGNLVFDGAFARAPVAAIGTLVAAALYLLTTGLLFGAVVGLLAVGWAMVGAGAVLPVVAVPMGVPLALWLGAGLLAGRAEAVVDALAIAAAERDWLVSGAGKVAHAGPVALVVLLPLLFLDLGALVLDASVLGALALLFLVFAGLVLTGAVPMLAVSLSLVLAGYLKRLRGRWRMWSRHQAGEL
jgi:hypothetical protein